MNNNEKLYDGFGLFDSDTLSEPTVTPIEVKPTPIEEKASSGILERLTALPMVPGAIRMRPEDNLGLLSFPIAVLHQLNACTLYLSVGSSKALIAFSTSRKAYSLLMQSKVPCFVGSEFRAVAYAAQNDRLWSRDFLRIVNKKAKEPTWVLTEEVATGRVYNLNKLSWSIGETLTRVHAELVSIEVYK